MSCTRMPQGCIRFIGFSASEMNFSAFGVAALDETEMRELCSVGDAINVCVGVASASNLSLLDGESISSIGLPMSPVAATGLAVYDKGLGR